MTDYVWGKSAFPDGAILQWVEAWDDPDAYYDFDVAAFARTEDGWYYVTDSGCSCYGPGDNPSKDFGPGTVEEMETWIRKEYANSLVEGYYANRTKAVLAALESIK